MTRPQFTFRLAFANFAASFACGGILAKGMVLLNTVPGFRADSMLAFLPGSLFSLTGILFLKRYLLRLGPWFSVLAALVSALLIPLTTQAERIRDPLLAWITFIILSFYFGLVFVPRTFRSDVASQAQGQLAGWSWGIPSDI